MVDVGMADVVVPMPSVGCVGTCCVGDRVGGGGLSTTGAERGCRGGRGSLPITDPDPDAATNKDYIILYLLQFYPFAF